VNQFGGKQLAQHLKGYTLLPDLPGEVAQAYAKMCRLALAHADTAARASVTDALQAPSKPSLTRQVVWLRWIRSWRVSGLPPVAANPSDREDETLSVRAGRSMRHDPDLAKPVKAPRRLIAW